MLIFYSKVFKDSLSFYVAELYDLCSLSPKKR